jgi:hypothetical protein
VSKRARLWKLIDLIGDVSSKAKSYTTMKELGLETPPETVCVLERLLDNETRVTTCADSLCHVLKSRFFSKERWRTWFKKMRLMLGGREFADAERVTMQRASREEREILGKRQTLEPRRL